MSSEIGLAAARPPRPAPVMPAATKPVVADPVLVLASSSSTAKRCSFLAPFLIKDFGLSNTELGNASGVLALTWALSGSSPGDCPTGSARRKPILITAVVLFSCFSSASGLMAGFVGLLAARALMGVAEGAVLPVSQSLMVEASREHRRGLNMGLVQSSSAACSVGSSRRWWWCGWPSISAGGRRSS